ncbi:MAG: hypothetical protein NXI31_07460 [bacterium]|nr:hypothetical protein [bacterium]
MTARTARRSPGRPFAAGTLRLGIALAIPATAFAQEARAHAADLGGANSATAEAALLALGKQAVPALAAIIDDWDTILDEEPARMIAVLRLVDQIGEDAADLQEPLGAILMSDDSSRRVKDGNGRSLLAPLLQAIGSTAPYAKTIEFHDILHHTVVTRDNQPARALFRLVYRHSQRNGARVSSIEDARNVLEDDKIFQREVAAESMRRSGTRTDAELLRDRLLDRDRKPSGWDALAHNGVTVPVDDDFALVAAITLVKLAADDAVSAIGHANIALHHPYPTRRVAALRDLARFGPDAGCAVPELLAIARHPDAAADRAAEAAEALKILGMCGRDAGPHYPEIVPLQEHADPRVKRRATAVVKMLGAMGFDDRDGAAKAAAAKLEEAAVRRAVTAAVAALSDNTSKEVIAAEQVLAERPQQALPALLQRLANERSSCPERVVNWIASIGAGKPEDERHKLCYAVATTGETWAGPRFSSSSGGGRLSLARMAAYGTLWVGQEPQLERLAEYLAHENGAVRTAAARELLLRSTDLAAAPTGVLDALWEAVSGEHPDEHPFHKGRHHRGNQKWDLASETRHIAALALSTTSQPPKRHSKLLRHALDHHGTPTKTVLAALNAWSEHADRKIVERAATDKREAVKRAAQAALARRDPGK